MATDILCAQRGIQHFARPRLATAYGHGTGCTLSVAIAALLAQGADLSAAVARATSYLWQALQGTGTLAVGRGRGPLVHLFAIRRRTDPLA
jgi:hydroxymethylpyrimidine/phosphomethylpyrimidine kinase